MVRRVGITTAIAAVLFAAASGSTWAALWLEFEPTHAASGTTVTGETTGQGAAPDAAGEQLPAYLVPSDIAVESPDDDSVEHIGAVRVDANGEGRIRFEVPDLAPGPYTVFLDCEPCTPPGFIPAGAFTVTAVSEGRDKADDDANWSVYASASLVVVASAIAASVAYRRRNRTSTLR